MTALPQLTDAELAAIADPAALLDHVWALEPWGRYAEREAALDRLQEVLDGGEVPPHPPGRNWRLEFLAERAIDVGRSRLLDEALSLVAEVKRGAEPRDEIALARAGLAAGQALAWIGTDEATWQANQAFAEAADRFAALGRREWQGSALLRRGFSACYQYGDLVRAEELIREALDTYPPGSERLPGALDTYANVLIDLGEFDRAASVIDRASVLARRDEFRKPRADLAWTRARLAAGRGDAGATERLLRDAEREAVEMDWFETHIGLSFLLEAAELLDRVGVDAPARRYLERARERAGDDNEEVIQTAAVLRARSGDPGLALEELQRLARVDWLEKRLVWRHTLLIAWATFRDGRDGAGEPAARALAQAIACGGLRVAQAGEPEIVAALAPLAEQSGSAAARELLLGGRGLLVRLFGTPASSRPMARRSSCRRACPASSSPAGPARAGAGGRHRARGVLPGRDAGGLRASDCDRCSRVCERRPGRWSCATATPSRLVPAWVDAREFLTVAERVRGASGARAVQLAYAALALWRAPLLPSDPYAAWAEEARAEVRYRHLALLDLVAADAAARGSHREALTALEAALAEDPDDERSPRGGGRAAAGARPPPRRRAPHRRFGFGL